MTNTERQAVRDLLAAAKRVGGDELKQKVWELLLIRKQIETNVRDGFCGPSTLDVVINDEWETLPCTYKDGIFTVTRGLPVTRATTWFTGWVFRFVLLTAWPSVPHKGEGGRQPALETPGDTNQ